jgi:Formate hydrogenlyase subunit 3/Multisubunit Na+/H+ antiporter, MnhD subunit
MTPPLPRRRPTGVSTRALRTDFFTPRPPVQWLSPGELARTGLQVAMAEGIGAYLDKREQQILFSDEAFREDEGRDELWLDYVADTGDGFHATYAVAYSLGQESLTVEGVDRPLPRANVLVFGGDQVYPTPSPANYDDRLRGPFTAALPEVPPGQAAPTIYALPGNHDWYDGLTAFLRVFATGRETIGAWRTRQRRSYFAVKLPHNWWLFGIDAQENAYIDEPQLEYFHRIINESLRDGDRIILCTPEPAWVQGHDDPDVYRVTDAFLRTVIDPAGQEAWLQQAYGGRFVPPPKRITVPLMISGDWHHYVRYERTDDGPSGDRDDRLRDDRQRDDRRHLVTCGGGGAYLLGTQYLPRTITTPPPDMRPPKSETVRRYTRQVRYPSLARSFWLGLGAPIRLPWRNPGFIAMLGFVQALLWYAWSRAGGSPNFAVVVLLALVLAGTTFLAAGLGAPHRGRLWVILLGLLHAAAQVLGVRAVMVPLVEYAWQPTLPRPTAALTYNLERIWEYGRYYLEWLGWYVAYGLVAGLVSAVVVGLYLVVASLFRRNINELFSAQRIEGYKSFIRLHIGPTGELTAYVIGIPRVRRALPAWRFLHWKANPSGQPWEPWFTPRARLRYQLIDTFTIR